MTDEGLQIETVAAGSVAEELEIEPGDRLLTINGAIVRDIIDYNYLASDDELVFLIKKSDGDLWEVEFDRPDEGPGITFAPQMPASCGNKCIFCFVHQLPGGLRKPLYVKDEDYRLSFLYGNYVTLSNILPEEIERIIEQRLSPLYISVHVTDNSLREMMLGRKNLVPVMDTIRRLADAKIVMHTQIVLCPGINDGEALEQSVEELASLYPQIESLAVVPLGLTRHRKGLKNLSPVTGDYAAAFVDKWLPRQLELENRLKGSFLYLADEFFIKGGRSFPSIGSYGDFPQIENGVGMIPLFMEEGREVISAAEALQLPAITVITGMSPLSYIEAFVSALSTRTGVVMNLVPVKNHFFGDEVTVTGLVTGADIISELSGIKSGALLLIPDVMLKEGEGLFLDDMTLSDIAVSLDCKPHVFTASAEGFYQKLVELSETFSSFP